ACAVGEVLPVRVLQLLVGFVEARPAKVTERSVLLGLEDGLAPGALGEGAPCRKPASPFQHRATRNPRHAFPRGSLGGASLRFATNLRSGCVRAEMDGTRA